MKSETSVWITWNERTQKAEQKLEDHRHQFEKLRDILHAFPGVLMSPADWKVCAFIPSGESPFKLSRALQQFWKEPELRNVVVRLGGDQYSGKAHLVQRPGFGGMVDEIHVDGGKVEVKSCRSVYSNFGGRIAQRWRILQENK